MQGIAFKYIITTTIIKSSQNIFIGYYFKWTPFRFGIEASKLLRKSMD